MLTLTELKKVNELTGLKTNLTRTIAGFSDEHEETRVGLIKVCHGRPYDPVLDDNAKFVLCKLPEIEARLTAILLESLSDELNRVNAELSMYIKEE